MSLDLTLVPLVVALLAVCLSYWLTGWVRSYAERHAILDHPTARSSHSRPTPRGGGLAIAVSVLLILLVGSAMGHIPAKLSIALGGGGALVTWIGWHDDRHHTPAGVRALGHCLAAAWAVAWLGGYPSIALTGEPFRIGLAGAGLGVVGIVWAINLFNFMDGIDGLAGCETVTVSATGAILLYLSGAGGGALVCIAICAAALGFLRWNWMPARIFLGDSGSNFLGFSFGTLAIWSENFGRIPAVWWGLAAMAFVFDATATLLRRTRRKERVYLAHRSHAYQRMAQSGFSHADVSFSVVGLNVWLGILAVEGYHQGWSPALPLAAGLVSCGLAYAAVERIKAM